MDNKALVWILQLEHSKKDRSGIYGYTQRTLAYNSNRIEGSTLTEAQTAALFEEGYLPATDEYYKSKDIVPLMVEMFEFIRDFEGDVPGASARDCGNYLDMNLPMAKYLAGKFYDEVLEDIREEQLVYPE